MTRMTRGRRGATTALAVALAMTACTRGEVDDAAPHTPTESVTAAARSSCLDGSRRVELPSLEDVAAAAEGEDTMRRRGLPDDLTIDMRDVIFRADQDVASPTYMPRPINIGDRTTPANLCLLAPYVQGTQDRELGWEYLKHEPGRGDHPAIRVGGAGWTVVDGARVDNMMNGIRPAGEGLIIRNSYLNYVRDDCIANDDLKALRVEDSLFDGCYTAISARPERRSALYEQPRVDTTMELDHVLIRLTPMPGGHRVFDSEKYTWGHIWKWSDVAGDTMIRDSVVLVEEPRDGSARALEWPDNVVAEDVTLVWAGEGVYPGEIPDRGVTVVDDVDVWEDARAEWLARHGCTDITDCAVDQLVAPAPRRS